MQKVKLILAVITGFLGALAFIIAANLPPVRQPWTIAGAAAASARQTEIMVLQISGVVLLIAAVLFLIFYFKGRKKAE